MTLALFSSSLNFDLQYSSDFLDDSVNARQTGFNLMVEKSHLRIELSTLAMRLL